MVKQDGKQGAKAAEGGGNDHFEVESGEGGRVRFIVEKNVRNAVKI